MFWCRCSGEGRLLSGFGSEPKIKSRMTNTTQLLDIEPRELNFMLEPMKQSSCSVRLINNTNYYVAFKVKTTNPRQYLVRPNVGILEPKSTWDFVVTMQAPSSIPPDMLCRDKFLVQSTVVSVGTTAEGITPSIFDKDSGRYVEENKLKVILASPPHTAALSPINGIVKQVPVEEASILKNQLSRRLENLGPCNTDVELRVESNDEVEPAKDVEFKARRDLEVEPLKGVEFKAMNDVDDLKLVKDVEEIKSRLNTLEIKLNKAEVTISKLTEEWRFPFVLVCMVALISVMLGHLLH